MAWADTDYGYKIKITIDHDLVSGDETDFPILVSVTEDVLRDEANGGHVKNSSGYDIVFYDSNEITLLKHEIEKYVNTTGEIAFWVCLTAISSTLDTDIYMYYSKSGVESDPSSAETWDSDYMIVYHMDDASGGLTDSTGNYDGTEQGTPTYRSAGHVAGYAMTMDGSTDFFSLADTGYFDGLGDFTIALWAYTENNDTEDWYMQFKDETLMGIRFNSGTLQFITLDAGGQDNLGTFSYNVRTYYYITATYDADAGKEIRVNYDTNVDNNSNHGAFTSRDKTNAIGAGDVEDLPGQRYFPGIIDETRISTIVRNDTWIETSYNSQDSPVNFLDFGDEEAQSIDIAWFGMTGNVTVG